MFEGRENWIGIALLVLCGLSAGSMLGYINAREVARFEGPAWQRYLIVGGGFLVFGIVIWQAWGTRMRNDIGSRRRWWRRDKDT
jgi:drug/metabolite transporter (DMT)-like permease